VLVSLASFAGGHHVVQGRTGSKRRSMRAAALDADRRSAHSKDAPNLGDFVPEVEILPRQAARKAANHCVGHRVNRDRAPQRMEGIGGTRIGQPEQVVAEKDLVAVHRIREDWRGAASMAKREEKSRPPRKTREGVAAARG